MFVSARLAGEFARTALGYEGSGPNNLNPNPSPQHGQGVLEGLGRGEKLLGSQSSVFSFTRSFKELSAELDGEGHIEAVAQALITVDGGPHTLWWYVILFCLDDVYQSIFHTRCRSLLAGPRRAPTDPSCWTCLRRSCCGRCSLALSSS